MAAKIDQDLFLEVVGTLGRRLNYDENAELIIEDDWTDPNAFDEWLTAQNIPEPFHSFFLTCTPKHSLESNHGPIFGVAEFMRLNDVSRNPGFADDIKDLGLVQVGSGPNGDFIVVNVSGDGECGWYPLAGPHEFIPTAISLGQFLKNSEDNWKSVPKDWYAAKKQSGS